MNKEHKSLLEEIVVEHKGIKVAVRIDYREETISLIDEERKCKKWMFNKRGVEYMESWCSILDAMKIAVKEGESRLREYLDNKEDEEIESLVKLEEELNK